MHMRRRIHANVGLCRFTYTASVNALRLPAPALPARILELLHPDAR